MELEATLANILTRKCRYNNPNSNEMENILEEEIVSIGPFVEGDYNIGNHILIAKKAGDTFLYNGTFYRIIAENDIIAKVFY